MRHRLDPYGVWRFCANPECGRQFRVDKRQLKQRYCSRRCARRCQRVKANQ